MTTATNGVDGLVARFRMAATIMRALRASESERVRVLELLGLAGCAEPEVLLVAQAEHLARRSA